MNSSRLVAKVLLTKYIIKREIIPVRKPKNNASVFEITPSGMGLVFVLYILLSISSSNHILKAADDPAPKLIESKT